MTSIDGKRIALTRSAAGNSEWAAGIEAAGAVPVDWPCISSALLPENTERLREVFPTCDWIAFTSARSVRALHELAPDLDPSAKRLAGVGEVTAEALRGAGLQVELVASEGTAQSLARELLERVTPSERVLLLGVREGRPEMAEVLGAAGRELHEIALYRTEIRARRAGESLPELDAVFFASPSAVQGFVESWELPTRALAISIGPSTTLALEAAGLRVSAEASRRNLEGMLEALDRALRTPARSADLGTNRI